MLLNQIKIKNFRNISEATIQLGTGVHYFHGLNGQGKTSILEAVHLLSNLKSFRDNQPQNCIQSGQEQTLVEGQFEFLNSTAHAQLRVELHQNSFSGSGRFQKKAFVNGKLSKSSVDYFGLKSRDSEVQFHAITLNPASTDLIRGDPGVRRGYLNQTLSSENPEMISTLKRYQKLVDQKNALLKEPNRYDYSLLKIINDALVKEGVEILKNRIKWIEKITPFFRDFLGQIAPNQEMVFLGTKTFQMPIFPGHFDPQNDRNLEVLLAEQFHQKLDELGHQENVRMTSLVGPHRDDLIFQSKASKELVDVGSQGEIRSVLLALKLAELESFQKETGVKPVFLIDDFSSELDEVRRHFLLEYLKGAGHQVLVTSTDSNLVEVTEKTKRSFKVVQGKVFAGINE